MVRGRVPAIAAAAIALVGLVATAVAAAVTVVFSAGLVPAGGGTKGSCRKASVARVRGSIRYSPGPWVRSVQVPISRPAESNVSVMQSRPIPVESVFRSRPSGPESAV